MWDRGGRGNCRYEEVLLPGGGGSQSASAQGLTQHGGVQVFTFNLFLFSEMQIE